jgi:hypothetical protein
MSYIGSNPQTQSFIAGTDYFNGDGSTTAFTLSRSVVSTNDIQATVNNVVQQPNTAYTVSGTTITFTSAPSAGTSNIYVRYLSTTTQSITPSQNTVSYSTLNSDNQSKLGISFKNRIINGAMTISQRGTSFSTSNIYTLDRWYEYIASPSAFTITQSSTAPSGFTNSFLMTNTTGGSIGSNLNFFSQTIEGYNIADLDFGLSTAKTFTLSFWVRSSVAGTYGGSFRNAGASRTFPFTYTISAANTWTFITKTIPGCTDGTWNTTNGVGLEVDFDLGSGAYTGAATGAWSTGNYIGATGTQTSFIPTNGATFYITGVQLEVGTQATTFDYRSIGTELALCQRYYVLIAQGSGTGGNLYAPIALGVLRNATRLDLYISFPVTMRTAPSCISGSGTDYYYFTRGGADDTFNSFTLATNSVTNQMALLYNQTEISGTTGQTGLVYTYPLPTSYVSFSAEL